MNYKESLINFISRYVLKPVYLVYEKWLWFQIKDGVKPRHIAIIPDGNRRWARSLRLNPTIGHELGYERMKDVLKWCLDLGVKIITVYALSKENIEKRDPEELKKLFSIFERGLHELLKSDIIDKYKVRVRIMGRRDTLSPRIRELISKVEEKTKYYDDRFLNIALGYSGREEIIDAVKKIIKDVISGNVNVEDVNEELFSKYLYTGDLPHPDPDLIIRTSGEERLSGFLLWQSAYSELYFCEVYWPEFRRIDFWRAIRSYQRRERRFGR